MSLDFLKNPIVLGVIASILTYLYLRWDNDRKYKNDPKSVQKKVSLLTPGIVGAVTWYIVANYMEGSGRVEQIIIPNPDANMNMYITNPMAGGNPAPIMQSAPINAVTNAVANAATNATNNDSLSLESRSYHLVGKGKINVPEANALNHTLPDMFIELDNFS
jgi:hypothetical protein